MFKNYAASHFLKCLTCWLSFVSAFEVCPVSTETLPFTVEWKIPVGCGFSGFYVEFLGIVKVLAQALPELRIVSGPCSEDFFNHQLFPEESIYFRKAYSPTVVGLGHFCEPESSSTTQNPSTDDSSTLLVDTDIPGHDVPRSRDGITVRDWPVCNCLCKTIPACVAWTYRKSDTLCWLKASTVPSAHVHGLISRRVLVSEGVAAVGLEKIPSGGGESTIPATDHRELRAPLPRVEVWHGRCDAAEVRASKAQGRIVIARLMTESSDLRNTPGVADCANAADEVAPPPDSRR
jgi:hypothetical protein